MKKESIFILALMLLIVIFSAGEIHAGNPDSIYRKVPELNGHTFIPLQKPYSPFITSKLKIQVGTAQTEKLNITKLQINGKDIYTFSGTILFSNVNLDYQQKIKDWLALYFRYNFTARFGTELSTLYTEGLNTIRGTEVGWLIKLLERKKHLLSGHVQISDYEANFMYINRIILNIIEDTVIAVSQDVPALLGLAGIQYAYAPNDLFGFGLLGEFAYGESFSSTKSDIYMQLGLCADINLFKRTGVPLGLSINYNVSSIPFYDQISNKFINETALKIAYTGGNDYMIGLDFSQATIQSMTQEYLNSFKLSLQFQMYF